MTYENQFKHFEKLTSHMKDILFKKGNDYANEDRLSNFKLAGSICGLTPEQNCLSLIATKTARLGVLLSNAGKTPNNESIRDSILDLANYAVLLDMIVTETANPGNIKAGIKAGDLDIGMEKISDSQGNLVTEVIAIQEPTEAEKKRLTKLAIGDTDATKVIRDHMKQLQ